ATTLGWPGYGPRQGKPLAVDLKLLRSGDSAGQMPLTGATFRFVRVGTKTYVDVTRSFFRYLLSSRRVPASACALICGKYVKLPPGAIPGLSLGNLAKMLDKHVSVPKQTPRLRVTTFKGRHAYKLSHAGERALR